MLVLEDEAAVRQTICEQLHLLGYLTLEANSGEQALDLLAASAEIDIFISDLMLPGGMSGAEVVNAARKLYPHLTLLLISGQDLRPSHNPRCRTWRCCANLLPARSWRRRWGKRIENPPLLATGTFAYLVLTLLRG